MVLNNLCVVPLENSFAFYLFDLFMLNVRLRSFYHGYRTQEEIREIISEERKNTWEVKR